MKGTFVRWLLFSACITAWARSASASGALPIPDDAFLRDLNDVRVRVQPTPQYEFRLHFNPNTGDWTCLSDHNTEGYNRIPIRQILQTGYGECAWLGERALLYGQFSGMELRGAGMYEAEMGGVDLRSADLFAVDARGAGAQQAYFNRARMDYSLWIDADLFQADLSNAWIRHAVLSRSQLNGAWLKGADLTAADLTNADLRDADLTGAVLQGALLTGAKYDDATRLPFDAAEAGRRGMVHMAPDPNPGFAVRARR